jgi:hypothetical protein
VYVLVVETVGIVAVAEARDDEDNDALMDAGLVPTEKTVFDTAPWEVVGDIE